MLVTKPTDLVRATRLGETFECSRRTLAHLDYTIAAFKRAFPKAQPIIRQHCYNRGVELSAGTHDYDACFDFAWAGKMPGLTARQKWLRLQRFLRNHGWGCWYRCTGPWADPSEWHVHGFTLPVGLTHFATKVGEFIDGGWTLYGREVATSQLVDYLAHAEGLKGEHNSGLDKTWFPPDIRATVFNYHAWVSQHPWAA